MASGSTLDQPVPPQAAHTRLVDQDGRALTLASLRGKVVVIAPLLTFCQETCPMTSANIHRAAADLHAAGEAGNVVFLEITVDPERDTVGRLHAYEKLYGALPDWRLATGKPSAVLAMWKGLGVSTQKTKPEDTVRDWLTGKLVHHSYDVLHQDVVLAVDPAGRLRWITVGRPDARGQRLPATLQAFLNSEGRENRAHPGARGASTWTAQQVAQAVRYVRTVSARGGALAEFPGIDRNAIADVREDSHSPRPLGCRSMTNPGDFDQNPVQPRSFIVPWCEGHHRWREPRDVQPPPGLPGHE